ncbi:MAG: cobalt-precorrin-6A reductase [Rhodospirillales bacterium]|nr:cobalt-precorrin-6A reductase [Rhodospirillales bacterium]
MSDPEPTPRKRLLILGGTAEGAEIARKACARFAGRIHVISSLAGRRPSLPDLPGEVRVGGFGGAEGLEQYLRAESIDWVIDATHPFAETISDHAYDACLRADVPRIMLVRAPWRIPSDGAWVEVADSRRAAEILPTLAKRAFLTTGVGELDAFSRVTGVRFLVRLMDRPSAPLPLADCTLVVGRPPFTLENERALFREHRIDILVTKHSGGAGTEAKIKAAMELGVRILLIRRPPKPPGESAASADEVIAWLARRL